MVILLIDPLYMMCNVISHYRTSETIMLLSSQETLASTLLPAIREYIYNFLSKKD